MHCSTIRLIRYITQASILWPGAKMPASDNSQAFPETVASSNSSMDDFCVASHATASYIGLISLNGVYGVDKVWSHAGLANSKALRKYANCRGHQELIA